MHLAARHGHFDVVVSLCQRMDPQAIDMPDTHGCSSFWYAAARGHVTIVDHLQEFSTSYRRDNHGYTPLAIAAAQGHTQIVRWLLTNCSHLGINSRNENFDTPLDLAIDGGHDACIEVLVSHGAETNRHLNATSPVAMEQHPNNHDHQSMLHSG